MPFLDSNLVRLLRCPITKLELEEASLERLLSMGFPEDPCRVWDAGLLRKDGLGVYPVRKGLSVLLAEELVLRGTAPESRPASLAPPLPA
jgi:hypothetical protein